MNFEYERSFSVKSIDKFVEYCENNGFKKDKVVWQNRIVFENETNNKLISRITKERINNNETIIVDFKNVMKKSGDLNQSLESVPLQILDKDMPAILSMLEILGFHETANNIRQRYVYVSDDVCFEIDEYIKPKMNVIAIEGNKNKVEKIYSELSVYI